MKPYDDCIYCGGQVEERLERIDYRYHGQLFILERVPTGGCTQCGEKYFTAEVAKQMEEAASQAQAERTRAVVQQIESLGRKAIAVQADVSEYEQVRRVIETTLKEFGGLHILVNNAGYSSHSRRCCTKAFQLLQPA